MEQGFLAKGAEKFNVQASDLELLGGFSNNVFECKSDGEPFVLKFYPSSEYNYHSILAELDWIKYLLKSGINVTAPLPSKHSNHIEMIQLDDGGKYYVMAFEKAKGSFIDETNSDDWNSNVFCLWGKVLGKIHSLSKNYSPSDNSIKQREWNEGVLFAEFPERVGELVLTKWNQYVNEVNHLPKDSSSYGMIHNDLHHKNFYLHNNELILFDFGDCEYNWFIYDIAIVLYHAIQTIPNSNHGKRKDFTRHFYHSFINGYNTENILDKYWLSKLPFFLNYRQIFSYLYFEKFLTPEQKNNANVKEILAVMKAKIENDIPYIDINHKEFIG
ncbi:Ser/Thr protein kinase RdoA involved in Cpx stress response, MazF antagonist [Evansella caseinilytica]|uniref:Ser/Thr protein kinase RdoA involved in Cpx stress response, MazF antagonist n=1 Tax=Evansella caseinilytica TaxID=1503961 RepID=A0A1H3U5E2_9BACI|nr:phosphotransferase [Evansella caseinilytica]SDZ57301.1 Ser/Thr protein kinase RdoA involved in Cpx stress response, MazF antagonist [Evansella caseinilytica]